MSDFLKALENYEQADEEGVMVLASRQAIHETLDHVDALEAENARLRESVGTLQAAKEDLQREVAALRRELARPETDRSGEE